MRELKEECEKIWNETPYDVRFTSKEMLELRVFQLELNIRNMRIMEIIEAQKNNA
jgi:hypothetical protein